ADGMLTYVYHLFPNTMVATFPTNTIQVIVEPLDVNRSLIITHTMVDRDREIGDEMSEVKQGSDFVSQGAAEDRAVACAIQAGLASGANEYFEFGRFEAAIGHFHRSLNAALNAAGA